MIERRTPRLDGPYAQQFNRLVEERKALGESKQNALINVVKQNPLLHAQYLAEANRREIPQSL